MLENYSSNATVAKIRTIQGRLLTKSQLVELASKKTVEEAAEFLKTVYRFKDTLSEVDSSTVHRGHLEELLEKSTFEMYMKLCKFQQLDKIPFYNYILKKREIEQLLSMINSINSNVESSFMSTLPGYVLQNSKLPFMEIAKCTSFDQLKECLKNTPYGKALKNIPLGKDGLIDYPKCELKLRTQYYEELFENIKHDFSSADSDLLSDFIKTDIQLINIVNAYRLKTYFNYSSEKIKERMLPFSKSGKNTLNAFYEAQTPEDMMDILRRSGKFVRDAGTDPGMIESAAGRARYKMAKRLLTSAQSAPAVMYAFMTVCDLETGNIIKIIEGIRYGLAPSEIEKLIIM